MEQTARELLRAIRGKRSQLQLARRLGYRSNPIAEWEGGRRFPTAGELFRACRVSGIDVEAGLKRFHEGAAAAAGAADDDGIAAWLCSLKGDLGVGTLAERAGLSRFAVSRWLSGRTRPRVPDFLRLVQAITGRLSELVGELVPIASVPSLAAIHQRTQRARRLLYDEPWAVAVLTWLESVGAARVPHDPDHIGAALGLDPDVTARCLEGLVASGVVHLVGDRLVPTGGAITVDTDAVPGGPESLKRHWSRVGMDRLETRGRNDAFGYSVFGVSKADYERIRELHIAHYRRVRAIVANSEPTDMVALLNLQLIDLTDRSGESKM